MAMERRWDTLAPRLSPWLLDGVKALGLKKPTPVQNSVIPLFLQNKDVVVEAVTGSGKTLSFLIPIIERLLRLEEPLKKHHVGAIIISPTRELATQIHSVLLSLLSFHVDSSTYCSDCDSPRALSTLNVVPQLLLSGTTTPAQDLSTFLRTSPNLIISTPGRLLELLSSPYVLCPQSSFQVLVLDEGDRLLDLGFKDSLQKIISYLPKQRRSGLFSASISEAVSEIVRVGLRNPVKIAVKVKGAGGGEDQRTPASLQMSYLVTPASRKIPAMISILEQLDSQRSIIFLSTCAAVDYFQHTLPAVLPKKYSLVPLHGKQPSNVRQKNFARFVGAIKPTVLLTTDVAARGLDIPQVDLVIQLDAPVDPKSFLHRAGRCGRAGREGLSVIFLTEKEVEYVHFLEIRKTPITLLQNPTVEVNDDQADQIISKMRDIVRGDRMIHDKSQRAFVSFVRAYSGHQASSIFRISDFDWTDQLNAWGLVRTPKMPELKKWDGDRTLGVDIDMSKYAYKDPKREKARLEALEEAKAAGPYVPSEEHLKKKREREAWSHKHDRQDMKEEKREKKKRKREAERLQKMTPEELEKEKELQALIEEVKRRKIADEGEEEFNGFSD